LNFVGGFEGARAKTRNQDVREAGLAEWAELGQMPGICELLELGKQTTFAKSLNKRNGIGIGLSAADECDFGEKNSLESRIVVRFFVGIGFNNIDFGEKIGEGFI
jgi:hypothetical protein